MLQAFNERTIVAEMVFVFLSKGSIYTFEFILFEISNKISKYERL